MDKETSEPKEGKEVTHKGNFMPHILLKGQRQSECKT